MLPLDSELEFDFARDEEFFAAIPTRAGVLRIEMRGEGALPYLRSTADLRRSCRRVLSEPEADAANEPAKEQESGATPKRRPRLNLRETAARVRYRVSGSPFEQTLALWEQAREIFPKNYRERMRLGPPALLKINLTNEYPRCYVAPRISADGGFYCGPFPSRRAAEEFAGEFLALFKVRRCHIHIRRDPGFPGCIYSEMKMCLAPCYAGCTKPEYDVEVARLRDFLASRGDSLKGALEKEREEAAGAEDFERAALVHKKEEKVAAILRHLPELPRRIEELNAAVVQPAAQEGSVAVFGVRGGWIAEPFFLDFRELSSLPRSVETMLRERLESETKPGENSGLLADHLSLLARWFYGKPRTGEIFFREAASGAGWPYRRILRGCARVLGSGTLLPPGPPAGRTGRGKK